MHGTYKKQQKGQEHSNSISNKHSRLKLALFQRQLQRGSISKASVSQSLYSTIIYVYVGVLGLMIMICVGLRYYIGIPQDRFPEVTERKEMMKDMTDEEKRDVLELIFQQHNVAHNKNLDYSTDPDDTESLSSKKDICDDEESLSSMASVSSAEDSSKKQKKIGSTHGLDEDLHDDHICSICLESLGTGGKADASDVLSAPNCSHKFHKECIMEWFLSQSTNLTCPDCRSQMFTVEELKAAAEALKDTKKN